MKVAIIIYVVLVACISDVLGKSCPRKSKKPGKECVDECQISIGCSDSNKECVCDGNCGYSCVKKSLQCSALKKPRNGKMVGKDRKFNSIIKFQCDPGYTLLGSSTRRCTAKGLWSGKKTRCKITCPDPGVPTGTGRTRKNSPRGFKEKTALQYYCLPGYTTTDVLKIICLKNKRWTSKPPVCTVKQCDRLKLPSNSYVRIPRKWRNKANHQLGTKVILSCSPGYRSTAVLFGRMQCLYSGWKLQPSSFVCRARSCGDPGTPRNGKKIGLSYTFSDVVRYTCDNCFNLVGASYRQCLADGTWSDSLPSCSRIACPHPNQLANGKITVSSQPIYCGSYAEYTCNIGHRLKGVAKRTCLEDRTWSDQTPKCEIVDCGNPGHPKNGITKATDGFTYGEDITFQCDPNYVLEGSVLATCESDGSWSKSLPKCLEKCSDPSKSTNAQVTGKQFYHGKQVRFSCGRDSILVPSSSRTLTCKDGRWARAIPICKASCPSLPQPLDGFKNSNRRTHGSTVKFFCKRGHKLVGSSSTKCNDGRWMSPMPRCLAICNTIGSINDGWVDGTSYLEGDLLKFRCRQNYVLVGEKVIKCMGSRKWNASRPTCNAPCRKHNPPVYGIIVQQGFKHNEEVEFVCDPDYQMEGSSVLKCLDGTWNRNAPKCRAPCKRFDAKPFPGGHIVKDGFLHDENVTFGCVDPLVIDGPTTLRCNDGQWNGTKPRCGGPCKKLSAPKNSVFIKYGYKHKAKVTFGCKQGFQLVGLSEILCNFGVWSSHKLPRCKKTCSDPSKFTKARVLGTDFYHGKKVEFFCFKDKTLIPENSKILKCRNGKWNGSFPTCKASCPHLANIPNGFLIVNSVTHGSEAQFECNSRRKLIGVSSARCNDGIWSNDLPKCVAECSQILSIKNGKVKGNATLEGSKIRFSCNKNFTLDGESVLQCTNAGKWNSSAPTCKASNVSTKGSSPATTATATFAQSITAQASNVSTKGSSPATTATAAFAKRAITIQASTMSSSPTSTITKLQGCIDKKTKCSTWASWGYCATSSQHHSYMMQQCKKACCSNSNKDCLRWAGAGFCEDNKHQVYMLSKCGAACNNCSC